MESNYRVVRINGEYFAQVKNTNCQSTARWLFLGENGVETAYETYEEAEQACLADSETEDLVICSELVVSEGKILAKEEWADKKKKSAKKTE